MAVAEHLVGSFWQLFAKQVPPYISATFGRRPPLVIKAMLVLAICFFSFVGTGMATETSEQFCDRIGHKTGTKEFYYCVNNLREIAQQKSAAQISAPLPAATLDHSEQICTQFGFVKNTSGFSECMLRLEVARSNELYLQQQYQIQKKQYDLAVAAQAAREKEIKEERDRQRWMALAQFGAGMANSRSSSFAGAMADGNAAMLGSHSMPPPSPPARPAPQSFTIHTPRGTVVTCVQTGVSLICN